MQGILTLVVFLNIGESHCPSSRGQSYFFYFFYYALVLGVYLFYFAPATTIESFTLFVLLFYHMVYMCITIEYNILKSAVY